MMTLTGAWRLTTIVLAVLAPVAASGQSGSYTAPADTVFTAERNPYLLYWVRGHDTTRAAISAYSITAQRWVADRSGFIVQFTDNQLNVGRQFHRDSVHLDTRGRATKPNPVTHKPEPAEFSLRLPATPTRLTPGTTWSDTLVAGFTGGGGPESAPHAYDITRIFRVTRRLDTLGAHVVEIVGDGTAHNSDASWADSAAGSYSWYDVTGSIRESYLYDPAAGRVLAHRAQFDLRGRGGRPAATGTDTADAAGLVATEEVWAISAAQAHLALRPLPGPDTSYTFTIANNAVSSVLFVHTEQFTSASGGSTIESGFARYDGLVGTIHATYIGNRVATYEALWSDSTFRPLHHRVTAHGDTVSLRADATLDTLPLAAIDTTMLAPRPLWAVADYGMPEFLSPLIRSVGTDTTPHSIAIFRPTARHWDLSTLRVKRIGNGDAPALLGILTDASDKDPIILIVAPDGTLLYAENPGPTGARRAPKASSPRQAEFLAIREQLQQHK
jgi:hypothetical protein